MKNVIVFESASIPLKVRKSSKYHPRIKLQLIPLEIRRKCEFRTNALYRRSVVIENIDFVFEIVFLEKWENHQTNPTNSYDNKTKLWIHGKCIFSMARSYQKCDIFRQCKYNFKSEKIIGLSL